MTRRLIGVIGHVDHGKTALVGALTGMETDRLPEEKQRGISIALGFAHCRVGAADIDFIDMPGHERFVRTMVSGATGMDAVLLVVAANEGVKPQTVEHVDIAGLLGVRHAIVAISKTDLADPEAIAAVGAAALALVRRAGMTAGPAMPVCALTGDGLDGVRLELARLAALPAPEEDWGYPYLPIDRSFSLPGHGTIVTGTLRRGPLALHAPLEILPGAVPVKIRGLQVHGQPVEAARPGQRVAVNVRGVSADDVPRGMALAAPGLMRPSAWLSVVIRTPPSAPVLKTTQRLDLLFGTSEIPARLRLLDREALQPGEEAVAQLHCSQPVTVPAQERFILRIASPASTVGGGRVLDPAATRLRRHSAAPVARLSLLATQPAHECLAREVERAGVAGVTLQRLASLTGLSPAKASALLASRSVEILRDTLAVSRAAMIAVTDVVPKVLARDAGLSREQLYRAMPKVSPLVLDTVLKRLAAEGHVSVGAGAIRLASKDGDRARRLQEDMDAASLAEAIRRGGLSPPDPAGLVAVPRVKPLLDRLVRDGVLIRTFDRVQKREIVFHRDAIEAAQRSLRPLLAAPGLLVKEAGAALGTSRKYTVPLLEYLTAIQFTRRVQDRHVLVPRD